MNEESANGRFTPAELAIKAKAKGYRWLAYQMNDENLGPVQWANVTAYREAWQVHELPFTVWLTRPFDGPLARRAAVESQAQGIILEGEIPAHRPEAVDWNDVIFHLSGLNIRKAVVTNNAPFVHEDGKPWPEKARPLIDDGWAYISECFLNEGSSTPEAYDDYATRVLGWARTQPMTDILNYDLSAFQNYSHWDAGNVLS